MLPIGLSYVTRDWRSRRVETFDHDAVLKRLVCKGFNCSVTYFILKEVLLLVILNRDTSYLGTPIVVEVGQLNTGTRSCNFERLLFCRSIIGILICNLLLFSFVEKCKVVLILFSCLCNLGGFVSFFPLSLPRTRWRVVGIFRAHLFNIFGWNLHKPFGSSSLAKYLPTMLFLRRLNEARLLAKELVTLVTDYIFYNHWPRPSVLNSEHGVRGVVCARTGRVLVALRA